MSENLCSNRIENEYAAHLKHSFLNSIILISSSGICILAFYIYSDLNVRNNLWAAATRFPPLLILLSLLLVHIIYRHKLATVKQVLYTLVLLSLQLMMYVKCLIHLHGDALAPSVTGTILVVFMISLDAKQNNTITALLYTLPIVAFTMLLMFFGKPSAEEFLVLADVYPIVFIGFIINRVQYRLKFRLFKTNHLLRIEQKKTKALYTRSLEFNKQLEKRAKEAILIKEEIQNKNKELNTSNATKDKFLAIIAHDLRNPIGAIWGLSDLLLVDDTIPKKDRQLYVQSINESIKHTHHLLENLLHWARAQNKAIDYEPLEYCVFDIIDGELKVLTQMANKKSISIENRIPVSLKVYADLNMFETIIRNIVSNAIKYTNIGGCVKISARLISKKGKVYTEIAVADNGVGIGEEKLSNLFQITKNVSTRGTNNEAGTGLGLLLCKEFVETHDGVISVESKPQQGSNFKFLLPMLN